MAYLLGQLIGSLVMIYLLMRLILLAFGTKKQATVSVVIAAGVAYVVVSVTSSIGVSAGGALASVLKWVLLLIPALAAMGIELIRVGRLRARTQRVASGAAESGVSPDGLRRS
jgi:hypothetical protein